MLTRYLNQYKIGQKIIAPVFLMLLAFIILFLVLIGLLEQKRDLVVRNIDATKNIINLTDQLTRLESQTEFDVLTYRFERQPGYLRALQSLDAEKERIVSQMSPYLNTQREKDLVAVYDVSRRDSQNFRAQFLVALEGGNAASIETTYGQWLMRRNKIDAALSDVIGYNTSLLDQNIKFFNQIIFQLIEIMAIMLLCTVLLIGFMSQYFRTYIIKPLRRLTVGVENFADDETVFEAPVNNHDEIGILARAFADLSQRLKESYANLRSLAFNDVLTGLPNRQSLEEKIEVLFNIAKRRNKMVGVLFLDLDRFKNINDSLGHDIGDRVLKEVAARLQNTVRETDVVARFGGDEFVILLSEINSESDAVEVAKKVMIALEHQIEIDNHTFFLSGSIGISVYPDDGATLQSLFRNADIALYKIKDRGRNGFQLYSAIKETYDAQRVKLEHSLKSGIKKNQLEFHYQPIVDLKLKKPIGVEALVRWNHPELGFLMPKQFISMAEETGLILPLGKWEIATACEQLKAWRDQGIDLKIAVNISSRQFMQTDILHTIEECTKKDPWLVSHLELEITESVAMKHSQEVIQKLQDLGAAGIALLIDDFGTGYSSLNYLKRFPLAKLKIDQAFVRDCLSDASDSAIIRAIISMAHSLNLKVIAEGVESDEQLAFLESFDCDEVQGFCLGKPMKPEELAVWLEKFTVCGAEPAAALSIPA